MSDIKVLEAQQWYNNTYVGKTGYVKIDEDGITGSGTCKALIRALQIELGLSGVDGVMGNGTINACPTISEETDNLNLVKIIQYGFYCKGYECGGATGVYSGMTRLAATTFRKHVGFSDNDGTMPPKFIKALLNTDAYKLVSGGDSKVRVGQQYLNSEYIINIPSIAFVPCNGIPDRNMMKGIIAALQYEEAGKTLSGVDGIYGSNTLSKAPELVKGTTKSAYVKIAQMCMMCMNEEKPDLTGLFDDNFESRIKAFQDFYCLTQDERVNSGVLDRYTWASLLSSKGESTRKAKACDCSEQILTSSKAKCLKEKYDIVGRYLTGTVGSAHKDKSLSLEEIDILTSEGLNIFPIYQDGGAVEAYFGRTQGESDAEKAILAAENLHIPYGTIIYFAVDYDFTAAKLVEKVVPHFEGINSVFASMNTGYRIGIYGARNVCSTICNAGLACSSFVSDMSTGYSGNLGYPLPNNWAFDQFYEYTESASDGTTFAVDKDAFSGRDYGFKGSTYCGGESYQDVTNHRMVLDNEGNYVCKACGYKVKSPELQDKDILSTEDYRKIIAGHSLFTYFANLNEMGIYYSQFDVPRMVLDAMKRVRAKSEYTSKYEYSNEDGVCQLPKIEYKASLGETYFEYDFTTATINSVNLQVYNGAIPEIIGAIGCILCNEYATLMEIKDIVDIATDFSNEKNQKTFLMEILTKLAELANLEAEQLLLSLLDLGITVEDGLTKGIEVGDYIVCYPINRETLLNPVDAMVVFSSDNKVKSIIYNAGTV